MKKFKMKTFLTEEPDCKQLFLKLEKITNVPDDAEVTQILNEITTNLKTEEGDNWLNHQLYQILCMNLEGKALAMVKNLHMKSDTNGVLGWCKLVVRSHFGSRHFGPSLLVQVAVSRL